MYSKAKKRTLAPKKIKDTPLKKAMRRFAHLGMTNYLTWPLFENTLASIIDEAERRALGKDGALIVREAAKAAANEERRLIVKNLREIGDDPSISVTMMADMIESGRRR